MIVPLDLDRSVRVVRGGRVLVGGDPPRAIRLSAAGARALCGLRDGSAADRPAVRELGRRLVDGGLAHPRRVAGAGRGGLRAGPPGEADVTVVIPVRDRPSALDRCLASLGDTSVLVVDDGSGDARAVAAVCRRHGCDLIRRATPGGPAAARNTALAVADTALVAFLDSDCVPEPGWLEVLISALRDPRVGAAAPRVRPVDRQDRRPVARYAMARSPLDLGPAPARVTPGGRIAYVPTAALLVRRGAIGNGFDPALRNGEDVDLIWRLHDAGWHVRYEPAATVRHAEPALWRSLSARRFRYGTSAAPLSRRHPGRLAPVVVHPGPAAVVGLAAMRRPGPAAVAAAAYAGAVVQRMRAAGVPPRLALSAAARGVGHTTVAVGRAATMLAPALLLAGLARRRTRTPAAALLLASPLAAWSRDKPDLDIGRWVALSIADDAAYGAGVWTGAVRTRTVAPLLPRRPTAMSNARRVRPFTPWMGTSANPGRWYIR